MSFHSSLCRTEYGSSSLLLQERIRKKNLRQRFVTHDIAFFLMRHQASSQNVTAILGQELKQRRVLIFVQSVVASKRTWTAREKRELHFMLDPIFVVLIKLKLPNRKPNFPVTWKFHVLFRRSCSKRMLSSQLNPRVVYGSIVCLGLAKSQAFLFEVGTDIESSFPFVARHIWTCLYCSILFLWVPG